MNLLIKWKQTKRYWKQAYGYQRRNAVRRDKSEACDEHTHTHTHTHTLLYTGEITNKDLLYVTGNSTQYFVITHMRKNLNLPESLGLQRDQTNQSQRKSVLNIHWKDWCWSSNSLATWYQELTHWKRPRCWERLKAGGEGDDRGWDGWMTLPTRWTGVWAGTRNWRWTGKPGVLQSMDHKESDMSEWLNLL